MAAPRIKADLTDLEIEEATSNSPFKKVPARRGPSEKNGRYSEELSSVENSDGASSSILITSSYDQNRPPSPPNFPFGRTSEGSAFRRIDYPGHSKTRSLKGQSTPKQESFTPGAVFSPDGNFVGGSIRRAGSRKEFVDGHDNDDDDGYLGPFQHHIPVPTPLDNSSAGTNNGESPSADRIIDLLSASSPELNLMGIVSQLINNPKWSPGQGDSPEQITSLLGGGGAGAGGSISGSGSNYSALEGLSRSDLLRRFNEMHVGDDDDDGDDFGSSSMLGQAAGPLLSNSPPRHQERRGGQRYGGEAVGGGFHGGNVAPDSYSYATGINSDGGHRFSGNLDLDIGSGSGSGSGSYASSHQSQFVGGQQDSSYLSRNPNQVQYNDNYTNTNPDPSMFPGGGGGGASRSSSELTPQYLSYQYPGPGPGPGPESFSRPRGPATQPRIQQMQQQGYPQQQQQSQSQLQHTGIDTAGAAENRSLFAPKVSESGPWVAGSGYSYDPSAVGMALAMSSSFDTSGSQSFQHLQSSSSQSQGFAPGSFVRQSGGMGGGGGSMSGHNTMYSSNSDRDPASELRRSGASDRIIGGGGGGIANVPGGMAGASSSVESLRNSFEGVSIAAAAMRSSYTSQRGSFEGGDLGGGGGGGGSFRSSYEDANMLRASGSSQAGYGISGISNNQPPPPPGPPPPNASDPGVGMWGQPQVQQAYPPHLQSQPQSQSSYPFHQNFEHLRGSGSAAGSGGSTGIITERPRGPSFDASSFNQPLPADYRQYQQQQQQQQQMSLPPPQPPQGIPQQQQQQQQSQQGQPYGPQGYYPMPQQHQQQLQQLPQPPSRLGYPGPQNSSFGGYGAGGGGYPSDIMPTGGPGQMMSGMPPRPRPPPPPSNDSSFGQQQQPYYQPSSEPAFGSYNKASYNPAGGGGGGGLMSGPNDGGGLPLPYDSRDPSIGMLRSSWDDGQGGAAGSNSNNFTAQRVVGYPQQSQGIMGYQQQGGGPVPPPPAPPAAAVPQSLYHQMQQQQQFSGGFQGGVQGGAQDSYPQYQPAGGIVGGAPSFPMIGGGGGVGQQPHPPPPPSGPPPMQQQNGSQGPPPPPPSAYPMLHNPNYRQPVALLPVAPSSTTILQQQQQQQQQLQGRMLTGRQQGETASASSSLVNNTGSFVSSNSSVASAAASGKGPNNNNSSKNVRAECGPESKARPSGSGSAASSSGAAAPGAPRPSAESKTNIGGAAASAANGLVRGGGQDLVESPQSKLAYKDFYKQFRCLERDSIEAAQQYAEGSLSSIPERVKWRVLLELADLAKRSNDFEKARKLYSAVVELQPLASQGWLEWSKMEEECGHLKYSLKILRRGLEKCNYNESLLTKAIKQQERLHNMQEARGMLSVLKHESIERVWKAVLEGALLEARAGRIVVARKFLRYLMEHVAWYGPIYFEAFKLEERDERDDAAFAVVKKGLAELPRYGPLWFGLMRIVERRDARKECRGWLLGRQPVLARLRDEVYLAIKSISRELVWKVHFERAQAEERAADLAAAGLNSLSNRSLTQARDALLGKARAALVRAVLTCPSNLHWKVWLAGARLELSAGSIAKARKLLCKAFATVPSKSRSHVFLECSRIEEYAGNVDGARRILARARDEVKGEWKVFLESVLLEARSGNMRGAVKAAEQALGIHAGTGRLWAILIQICHRLEGIVPRNTNGSGCCGGGGVTTSNPLVLSRRDTTDTEEELRVSDDENDDTASGAYATTVYQDCQYPVPTKKDVLLRALNEVPKSGEVWCEGARCHMNPLHLDSFDLSSAQKYLCFAVQFTPQYGDTFVELLRLEMIAQVLLPRVLKLYGLPLVPFLRRFLNEDCEADIIALIGDFGWLQSVCGAGLPGTTPRTGILDYSADASGAFSSTGITTASSGSSSGRSLNSGTQQYYAEGIFSVPATPISRQSRRHDIDAIERMDLDLGHLVEAYKSICTKSLSRRCSNSDPNYGAVWFHSRQRSFDTPSTVLKSAVDLVAFELAASQAVYVRAVSHYVRRCIEEQKRGIVPEVGSESTRSSISAAADSKTADAPPPPSSASKSHGAATMGASTLALVSTSSVAAEGDFELMNLLAAQEDRCDQTAREDELLADFRIAESIQDVNWPVGIAARSVPLIRGGREGIVFAAPDFVTASIDMNRLVFNRHLNNEDRRRVLLSSDQIIP